MAITMDCEVYLVKGEVAGVRYGVREMLKLLDDAGIQYAVVMPVALSKPDNRWIAERVRNEPRLLGSCCVNPNFGDKAAAEFEKAVKDWGMKSLKLMPTRHGYDIESPIVHPLMEIAKKRGIPATIHSGSDGCYPLQIRALAEAFPQVPIIMDHMGFRYHTDQAILAARKCANIYLGTTITNCEPYLIKKAVDELGARKVVFGSNAPSAFADLAVEGVKRLRLKRRDEERILGENLAAIYGLKK